jgi:DNA-binding transcriptional MerR regulator/quercetin dioxygenase-like cupin family protein
MRDRKKNSRVRRDPILSSGYLTVGQAARVLGVSSSSLRQWENLGLIAPARSGGRFRLYSPEMLDELKRIKYLRDVKQFRIGGIKEALQEQSAGQPEHPRFVPELEQHTARLGTKLRRLRKAAGLRLVQAADKVGISAGFLSAIELSQANPSISTLQKLAAAYDTTVLALYNRPAQPSRIVRKTGRHVLRTDSGIAMELLSTDAKMLQSMLFRLPPGTGSDGAYAHEGEEFIYMLQGTLELWLDEWDRSVLYEGDSFWFESTRGHRWFNPSEEEEAVLLWVNTPPTF